VSFKATMGAVCLAVFASVPALAEGIMVMDPYARASTPMAKSGAAFMQIMNHTGAEDRLIAARSDAAKKVELHTHVDSGDGVMKMMHVEEGFAIPAGETHSLARGGDHVMLMGLTAPFEDGASIDVTLVFENAGDVVVQVPIDLKRQDHAQGDKAGATGEMDHSGH
jgi:copper(I)-binding protein